MDYQSLARIIHRAAPSMTVATLLDVADAVFPLVSDGPDLSTHEGRVALALGSPEVIEAMTGDKKIQAIKALRALTIRPGMTTMGLKDAKDAVEDPRVAKYLPVRSSYRH